MQQTGIGGWESSGWIVCFSHNPQDIFLSTCCNWEPAHNPEGSGKALQGPLHSLPLKRFPFVLQEERRYM